jgi:hypothetical protein
MIIIAYCKMAQPLNIKERTREKQTRKTVICVIFLLFSRLIPYLYQELTEKKGFILGRLLAKSCCFCVTVIHRHIHAQP